MAGTPGIYGVRRGHPRGLGHYTGKILKFWQKTDPGACAAHQKMLPPQLQNTGPGGRYLCVDPEYAYRPEDREIIKRWLYFKRTAAAALLCVWGTLLAHALFN